MVKVPGTRDCASETILGDMSKPVTWRPALLNMEATGIPVPQPISRTFDPGGSKEMALATQDFLISLSS